MVATRLWPVVTLVSLFVLEILTWWGLLETAAEKLRSKGPVGVFLLEALTSPIVRMALIIAAIVWVVKRPERAGEQPPLANVNLKTLASFYREHTTLEANRLLEGFKGKNIAIEGIVLDMFKTEILVGGLSVRVRSKAG